MTDLVLLHGWGTHSGVWHQCIENLDREKVKSVHSLDFPGYGELAQQMSPSSLEALAENALDRAPQDAIWAGWSLGGMVALQAALMAPERVRGLMMVCSTPRFVASADWPWGTQIDSFETFVESLDIDYQRNLRRFLLLQAGDTSRAKELSQPIRRLIETAPQPARENLRIGLDILRKTDLRVSIESVSLSIPARIVSGSMDRICHPGASLWLADNLHGSLLELRCGHGPLLSHPEEIATELEALISLQKNGSN